MPEEIPKRIFMYWADGFESAPEVVQIAVDSWRSLNPEFELVLLDDENLSAWFDPSAYGPRWRSLRLSHQSDVMRLALLATYGGFWTDATLVCTKPLSEWLDFAPKSGIIVLRTKKGKNRFVQSFFLGSVPHSWFMTTWLSSLLNILLSDARAMTPGTQKRWKRRRPVMWRNSLTTSMWALKPLVRITGYPYLVVHYVANRMILSRPRALTTYLRTPRYWAGEALHLEATKEGAAEFKRQLHKEAFPLWKLSWRSHVEPEFWAEIYSETKAYLTKRRH